MRNLNDSIVLGFLPEFIPMKIGGRNDKFEKPDIAGLHHRRSITS